MLVTWAKRVGQEHSRRLMAGEGLTTWRYMVANQAVFTKVKQNLGLDRVKVLASAAAPLSKDTMQFFSCLDLR